MENKKTESKQTELMVTDNSIDEMFALEEIRQEKKLLSYIPSFFTTASLPFRNVKSPVFVRKGSNGITLKLSAPENVPFGKYGRLLLTLLTTHAVLSKEKDSAVIIEYPRLLDMLNELQLPKSRGPDIREQLECFTNASFAFEQKVTEIKSGYLFEDLYEDGKYPKNNVTVTTHSTGNIRFTTGVQFQEVDDKVSEIGLLTNIIKNKGQNFFTKMTIMKSEESYLITEAKPMTLALTDYDLHMVLAQLEVFADPSKVFKAKYPEITLKNKTVSLCLNYKDVID